MVQLLLTCFPPIWSSLTWVSKRVLSHDICSGSQPISALLLNPVCSMHHTLQFYPMWSRLIQDHVLNVTNGGMIFQPMEILDSAVLTVVSRKWRKLKNGYIYYDYVVHVYVGVFSHSLAWFLFHSGCMWRAQRSI